MNDKRAQSPSNELLKVINKLLDSGSSAVLITVMTGMEAVGSKLLVPENEDNVGTLGDAQLDSLASERAKKFMESREDTRVVAVNELAPEFHPTREILLLFERIHPAPRLVICGAGHVGTALAKLGSFLGYHTTLIDDRAEFVSRDRFPDQQIELIVADHWSDAVRDAISNGKGVSIAVVTRGHNEDEQCMRAISNVAVDYVGLIGSKRRTNIVIANLRQSGVPEERLKSIRAPIGLDIGAVTPEEVALAIIAEIVAEHHGRKGQSLSEWRRH